MASLPKRFSNGSFLAVTLAVVLGTLAVTLIRANVEESIAADRTPLPVAVTPFVLQDNYQRSANYVGVIRAGSDSAIGFEVAGTIRQMPAKEGLRVSEGELLVTLDTERREAQRRAAEGDLARINAELELAKLQRQRLADLESKGLASKQNYDEARLNEQALNAAQGAVAAALRSAELEIEKSRLYAPFDGVIAERLVQAGAVINAGTPVLRLIANDGYEAHIGVPVDVGNRLAPGSRHRLTIAGQSFDASLRAVRRDVDPSTLTVGAVFELPADVSANAGESALLTLSETVAARGGWLPITALIEGDRGLWSVLVVAERDGHDVALRESVEILYSQADRVFVRGTLADRARVVATGLQRLSPGSPIAVLPNPAVAGIEGR